jgi:predicted nuclease with TOPRIM domain
MGQVNRELTVVHHSPYDHAVALVGLLNRELPMPAPAAPMREMARLVRTQHDAQARVVGVLNELQAFHRRHQSLVDEHGRVAQELAASRQRVADLEDERRRLSEALQELVSTRRWRAASTAARPLEWVRRRLHIR